MSGSEAPTQARLVAGRYRLLRELGRGGMGLVWQAEDQLVSRQVAVKELRPPQGLADDERAVYARRALQEARSVARVHHPGAVTLYDVLPATADDGAVYLIMELISGPALDEVIKRGGPLPDATVAAYGRQLLAVLEVAHGLGIVHRDIKPGNILIAPGDEVKLADFGIAHAIGGTRLTGSGVLGTHAYLAPELFEPKASITPAADLWSLGATLYHAIEGRGPFERDTTSATLRAILIDDIRAPACSPGLAAAITGLLRRDPARRATIEQARAHLLQEGTAVPATPASSAAPSVQPPAGSTERAQSGTAIPTSPPRWEEHATTRSPAPDDGPGARDSGQQAEFSWISRMSKQMLWALPKKSREEYRQDRGPRVFVYPWGFHWTRGDEESRVRWDQVTDILSDVKRWSSRGREQGTQYTYTLTLADGKQRKIYGWLDPRPSRASQAVHLRATPGVTTEVTIEQLGRLFQDGVTRARLPEAIDRFNAGQTITFGPVTVNLAGISAGKKSLPWSEIEDVQTKQGWVSVKKEGKWLTWKSVPVRAIPNYFVFDALVRAILAKRPSTGRT